MKKEKWVKTRHRVIVAIARVFLGTYTALKYHVKVKNFKEGKKRQFLVLFNHQTAYDQFFVGMAFKSAVYFLASEDLFSIGFVSKLLRFAVAPIPIKKQTTDLVALKNLLKVASEGGTIAIAPEGQRTYSGETTYINPAIVTMARKLNLPIAIFKIEGGYGIQPRWSDVVRKGRMKAGVSRVIEPSEYENLSKEEFEKLINKELYVNEACVDGEYKHKKTAEYLERAIYVCPECGLSTFYSKNDIIECKKCGLKVRYLPTKELEGVDRPFHHRFVLDWYNAQNRFVNGLDLTTQLSKPLYEETADFKRVIVYKCKELLEKDAVIKLFGDRIEVTGENIGTKVFSFDDIRAVTVLGKNKANIYADKEIFQIEGDAHFNSLKYVNFFHRYKNIRMGKGDVEFLGL